MTLTDRHLDELKRQQWLGFDAEAARYGQILAQDPKAILPLAALAVRNHDAMAICAIGEALAKAGALDFKPLGRAGFFGVLLTTLVEEERYQAALDVFNARGEASLAAAKVWVTRARAEAGLGNLTEARLSITRALELDRDVRDGRELKALLVARRDLRARLAEGVVGWGELRRLVDVYLELGMKDAAAQLITVRLRKQPAPQAEDYEDGLQILRAALEVVGPEFVLGHAKKLAPVRQDDRLKALQAQCLIALGRPEEAALPDQGGRDLRLQRAIATAETGEVEEAVGRLGRLSVKLREDLEVRAALDFYVGRSVLEQTPLELPPATGPRRIFNLMPFNDEIEILKIHLAEMAGWVDQFVLVESEVTFTGQPKPLYFERHKAEFAPYADKIRHIVVGEHPEAFHSPWGRDFRQRDLAVAGLSGLAAPDDLVLLTDVDEIVDHRALEGFDGDLAGLRMAMFRFFLNYRPTTANLPVRRTGAVCKARVLQRFGSSYIRFDLARRKDGQLIDAAGWHFTSMFDPARLVAKVNSYAHQERSIEWRNVEHVDRRLADIKQGRFEPGWERAELDDSFPAYMLEHAEELGDLLISATAEETAEAGTS
jgi:beta-1,4-mannosyl-glycoprotein beta-1,4-N-acetylglucosaminyltransferase